MKAVVFPEANDMLIGSTEPPVADLAIHRIEGYAVISCWELDDDDLAMIAKTRRLFLIVNASTHPPVKMEVARIKT